MKKKKKKDMETKEKAHETQRILYNSWERRGKTQTRGKWSHYARKGNL
jgi:hypothetical protein